MSKYPTWTKVKRGHWISAEQVDGTPDYRVERLSDGLWWLKCRTSARYETFTSRQDAMAYVRAQANPG